MFIHELFHIQPHIQNQYSLETTFTFYHKIVGVPVDYRD